MSQFVNDKKKVAGADDGQIYRIRVTLTSTKVKALEKVCAEVKRNAISKNLQVSGPVRLPTKRLKITTRKSPNGEGTNTWDRFEMRVHKRVIDLHSNSDYMNQMASILGYHIKKIIYMAPMLTLLLFIGIDVLKALQGKV